ncbi:MAG: O-antigen ligase family protein [Bacteroidaceae bacterium]|nr:O-antigen ligase family protein [Bacteroidaceae bacterium]
MLGVTRAIIVWGLIAAGALEAVWGLLQVYGYEPSNHSLYALTGSFYNPGPYSGFLAMCLPLALHEWLEGKRIWKHLALVAWVLMLVVLPSGMSRSAWLAALVASGYVLGMHYRDRLYRFRKFFWIGGLLLILLGVGAYHWKKDSADGRLLMWKVAIQAVLEYPWQGVGWENVAGAYGDAQERSFASGVASEQEVHVAGAPEYVFNEYLQVAMAWGVPALCGILLLVGGCFCLGHRGRMFGVCGALLSLSVFSFSSYPFQFLEFIVAFGALLVACLMRLRNVYLQVAVLIIGIGVCLYLYDYREEHPMRKAHTMFNRAHSLHKAGEWEASTEILKETMRISSDAMILNIIGKNCQALGEYKEAEEWFIRSTHRLPNRIYPYYLLAKLYAEHPKYFPREKLEWAVRMVLEKEAKVESTAIKQMREEVKILLDENQSFYGK